MTEKYNVTFDGIMNGPQKPETEEEKLQRIQRSEETKRRKEKWLAESQERPGIPGRSKLIERNSKSIEFISKTIIKEWEEDPTSELYYYNDIRFLSGSAGYCLKKSDGTHLTQRTMIS